MNEKLDLEGLYYLLMSSWIYGIEKTREELLGDNIAYTRRLGWNATEYIMSHLESTCGIDLDIENKSLKEVMESIIKCLEAVGFIKEGTVTVEEENDYVAISMTACRAEACKELVKRGVIPHVCLRSIVLANFLENLTNKQYSYHIDADPEGQPGGKCTSYLGDIS
ncbi:MAG: hypothetical protein HVN35_08450 [Methanobacteriaceae archaeon]|nr:hypothetical protein [Methanobacteriaceae archaeon]